MENSLHAGILRGIDWNEWLFFIVSQQCQKFVFKGKILKF